MFAEKAGAPGLELPPELQADVVDGRFRVAAEANAKLHEVFGGAAGSLECDDVGKPSSSSEGSQSDGDGDGSGGGGSEGSDGDAGADGDKAEGSGGGAPKKKARGRGATRAPRREGSARKPSPAASALALAEAVEAEMEAAKTARDEQRSFHAEVLKALKAGPDAVPLHSWVETLHDDLVEWLVTQRLLSARFTTDGCTARVLTKEEKDANGINLKIHKRLLQYGVVLD